MFDNMHVRLNFNIQVGSNNDAIFYSLQIFTWDITK